MPLYVFLFFFLPKRCSCGPPSLRRSEEHLAPTTDAYDDTNVAAATTALRHGKIQDCGSWSLATGRLLLPEPPVWPRSLNNTKMSGSASHSQKGAYRIVNIAPSSASFTIIQPPRVCRMVSVRKALMRFLHTSSTYIPCGFEVAPGVYGIIDVLRSVVYYSRNGK